SPPRATDTMTAAPADDVRSHLSSVLSRAIEQALPDHASAAIVLERPRRAGHGDYACNVAMQLARTLKVAPRDIAARIVAALPQSEALERAEVAGAGFINLHLRPAFKQRVVQRILSARESYGRLQRGRGKRVQVEFVSANPTGPLHVGHGRGAAYGASLANVLEAAGFDVTREYYVNDAGRQIDILALSTWLCYLEACGLQVPFPRNAYQGEYVREMARALRERHADRLVREASAQAVSAALQGADDEAALDALIAYARERLGADYDVVLEFALAEQLADCRADLAAFGVTFDNWYS